tara:strand:- start:1002 stop:1949 length:948 start_codon:yes stop_codon:yes gene_type:complete
MITRTFRTSRPYHYIIFLAGLIGAFLFQRLKEQRGIQSVDFVIESVVFLFFLASMFLVVFIITKNKLTQKNSFAALYFSLLIFLMPQALSDHKIIIANGFILLSYRRIFSLGNKTNMKKKYFDASLWLSVATLFYVWSIFYFVPLLVTIILSPKDWLKHSLVLVFGAVPSGLLVYLFTSVFGISSSFLMFYLPELNFDIFSSIPELMKVSVTIISVMTLGSVLCLFSPLILKNSKSRNNFIVLFLMLFTGLIISLLAVNMFTENILFLIFPLAVIMANYTQHQRPYWVSDLFLIVLVSLVLLNVGFNIKNQILFC